MKANARTATQDIYNKQDRTNGCHALTIAILNTYKEDVDKIKQVVDRNGPTRRDKYFSSSRPYISLNSLIYEAAHDRTQELCDNIDISFDFFCGTLERYIKDTLDIKVKIKNHRYEKFFFWEAAPVRKI